MNRDGRFGIVRRWGIPVCPVVNLRVSWSLEESVECDGANITL